jgi:hypothetical protein
VASNLFGSQAAPEGAHCGSLSVDPVVSKKREQQVTELTGEIRREHYNVQQILPSLLAPKLGEVELHALGIRKLQL